MDRVDANKPLSTAMQEALDAIQEKRPGGYDVTVAPTSHSITSGLAYYNDTGQDMLACFTASGGSRTGTTSIYIGPSSAEQQYRIAAGSAEGGWDDVFFCRIPRNWWYKVTNNNNSSLSVLYWRVANYL